MTTRRLTETKRRDMIDAFRSGLSRRQTTEKTGLSNNTVSAWWVAFELGFCRCKQPLNHDGACPAITPEISTELRAKVIAARVDDDASVEEVLLRFPGQLTSTQAYKILKGQPRRFRTRTAAMWYTEDQVATLRRLYPMAPRAEVMAALPGRKWKSIEHKANMLGVSRHPDANVVFPDDLDPLMRVLRRVRQEKGLTAAQVAARCDAAARVNRDTIIGSETGHRFVNLRQLRSWATALGLTVELRTKATPVAVAVETALPRLTASIFDKPPQVLSAPKSNTDDEIAKFLSNGGKIVKVPAGVGVWDDTWTPTPPKLLVEEYRKAGHQAWHDGRRLYKLDGRDVGQHEFYTKFNELRRGRGEPNVRPPLAMYR